MAERGVTQIVGQRHGLGQIFIEAQRPGDGACHLADFKRVCQAGAVVQALVVEENLGFVLEAPEGCGMDDAIAIALEFRAGGLSLVP